MATLKPTLSDPLYANWVKTGLSLLFTREGIEEFVKLGVNTFHQDVLNKIWQAPKVLCQSCTTANVTARGWKCPNGICDEIRKEIVNSHRFKRPSWNNSDAQQWGTNPWELAKCFMPATGYSAVSSAAETDFSGLVNVVINLTDFQNVVTDNLSLQTNIFCQARKTRNTILHTSTFKVTDQDLISYIDIMIQLLSDAHSLATDKRAVDAILNLLQIKTGSLTVSEEDETKLRAEAIKAIEQKRQEAVKNIHKEGKEQTEQIGIEGQKAVMSVEAKSKEGREHIVKEGQKAVMRVEAKSKEEREHIDKDGQKAVMSVEIKSKEEREHIVKDGQKAIMKVEAKSKEERKLIDKEGQKGVKRIIKEGKKQSEVLNKKRRLTIMSVEAKSKEGRKHIDKEGLKKVKRIIKEGKKQSEVLNKTGQQTIMSVEAKGKDERKHIDQEGQKGLNT